MIVWGAWAEVCSLACAPHISFSARGCGDVVRVLSASARQWWALSSGSRPRAPTSFGVGFVPLSALYPPRFAVRASDAFSRAYTSTCAFRSCLAVYGPYSEREMGVVGCGGMLMALVARLAVSFLSRVSIKNTPAHKRAGVFFRVGAPYVYSGALRAYRQGRSQSGSMCVLPA